MAKKPAAKVLPITGDLTIYTAATLKEEIVNLLEQSADISIDLAHVSEMDTAGLQLLILAKKEATVRGGELQLLAHSPAVLAVLDMCNMANYFGDPVVISSKSH
jgi:anti-sigma B factor antagonist